MNTLKSIWRDFTNASLLEKLVMIYLLVGLGFLAYAAYHKIWPPTDWVVGLAAVMAVFVYIQQAVILRKQYMVSLLKDQKTTHEIIKKAIACFEKPHSSFWERIACYDEATKQANIYFPEKIISKKLNRLFRVTMRFHELNGYADGQKASNFVATKDEIDEAKKIWHEQCSLINEIHLDCRSHMRLN